METKETQNKTEKKVWITPTMKEIHKSIILGNKPNSGTDNQGFSAPGKGN